MYVTCLSDCHGHYPKLEGGDLLIVAGDLTGSDKAHQYVEFFSWLNNQDYLKKVVIAGNHDNLLQKIPPIPESLPENISYLCDSGTEYEWFETHVTKWGTRPIDGGRRLKVKIYGSPWTKTFPGMNPHCKAFTVDSEEELADKWALIPKNIDILITHSPSLGVLDEVERSYSIEHCGSESLIKPMIRSGCRFHVFGHIHEGYGKFYNPILGITYVNASHVNERYEPVNKPIRMEI